ncbi:MAG: amino acid-binding protein [Acidobacteriota bacterium]|nr:amino acid-binding protein [Acidobacteriota bacterium]
MKIHQISLFAENRPGRLSAPARLLAAAGIDLRALYLADTLDFGILRIIVADWEKAARVLEEDGFVVKVNEVVAVEVSDRPGGLADVLEALDGSGLNIEYMYAFPYLNQGKAVLIFRFDDPDAASARLQAARFNVLADTELLTK